MQLLVAILLLFIAWDVDIIAKTMVHQAEKQVQDDFDGDDHDRIYRACISSPRLMRRVPGVPGSVECKAQGVLGRCC
jgi:hypothetical protein